MRTGQISVQTQDIFPIIKKWLYSEHDIFLRELVANACDAITKRESLGRNRNVEVPEGKINIVVDQAQGTLIISDNGVGMTEEQVEKYIAQLAFSGAEEFVQQLKDQGADTKADIIGKFGLGFYSAFMVADKVVVESLSMEEGAQATRWECEGNTDYSFASCDKSEVGTTITLYINQESKDFLHEWKLKETLNNHCHFMPYPIFTFDVERKKQNEKEIAENNKLKDGDEKKREITPYEATQVNNPTPLWKKDPAELKDEDYRQFYRELFPAEPEPLFWIHLNVDHPFTLQGILYFPKFNPTKPIAERGIRLFCRQVFVSDDVKNIMPEYLSLLKGAIDSVDIPLNVSRSALQGDPNVRKISNYITKRVGEALKKLFKADRAQYEKIWQDIHLFVKYGLISDQKFHDLMRPYLLFKNTEDRLVTLEEYRESIPEAYQEKLKGKIIYFDNKKSDPGLRKQLKAEGIESLETEDYIDPHLMQQLEMNAMGKEEKDQLKFVSVDQEVENLLTEGEVSAADMELKDIFQNILVGPPLSEEEQKKDPMAAMGKMEVEVKSFKGADHPAYFKVDEQMKRLQQMSQQMGQGGNFPLKKTLVVNPKNPLIQNVLALWKKGQEDLTKKLCHYVQDLALISSEGLDQKEKDQFVTRSQHLVQELSQMALQ